MYRNIESKKKRKNAILRYKRDPGYVQSLLIKIWIMRIP